MSNVLTTHELRKRLVGQGHVGPDMPDATEVLPSPDRILTVGLHLDPTLKQQYRQRYFAVFLESQENPVPVLRDEPDFAIPENLRSTLGEELTGIPFIEGPFRWLLRRLSRFDALLVWPRGRDWRAFEELSGFSRKLQKTELPMNEMGAWCLDLRDTQDRDLLWEIGRNVPESFHDFYVADLNCEEVYVLHHHEKVVASITNQLSWEESLEELKLHDDCFENCSGYDD